MINDRETLEYLFKIVKFTKKPIVKIYPNGNVIGTDEQFASINHLVLENNNINISIPYIFRLTELSAFMRILQDCDQIMFDIYEIIALQNKPRGQVDILSILPNHAEMGYKIDQLFNKVIPMQYNKILYKEENIQAIIPNMFVLKIADGAKMFTIDKRFIMTSFGAIHPANKSDRVDLIIRDLDIYSYVAEFIIYKNKYKYQLHEFLRFRKI